jgi:hypothetical protein
VVVDDFDFVGIAISPLEADSELIIHTQAPLTFTVALQPLKPVSGRFIEFLNPQHSVNLPQLPECNALDRCIALAMPMIKNLLRVLITKRADHFNV